MVQRLRLLAEKLQTEYDRLGQSYLYFVCDPNENDRLVPEILLTFVHDTSLSFVACDLLQITIETLEGKEERYEEVLNDPMLAEDARCEIVYLWAEATVSRIVAKVA